jgi:uncharacterized RDD family membrane protein YckC
MQWADDVRIETPEQIDLSLELAGLGSRFVAWVVDWLFKGLALLLLGLGGAFLVTFLASSRADAAITYTILAVLMAVGLVFLGCYDIYFEVSRNGQTPGKKTAGIRVIRESGAPVDFRAACIRYLLALADFLPGFFFLGGLLVLVSTRSQRLGDMAAGTLVIRERALAPPGNPIERIDQFASEEFVFTASQLAACQPADRLVLREFFKRYQSMGPRPRHQLALRLAEEFRRKTAYEPREPLSVGKRSEGFLASLFRDLEKVANQGKGITG